MSILAFQNKCFPICKIVLHLSLLKTRIVLRVKREKEEDRIRLSKQEND
jgi:hypothetical protein